MRRFVSAAMTQSASIGAEARIRNPALAPLAFLIGDWQTTGTHPLVPGKTLCGRTSFAWHEGGAFLIMRSEVDEPQFPSGVAIIGSDDGAGTFAMTYFDERGVSRLYRIEVGARSVTWQRDDPALAQSMTIAAGDGDTLVGTGRMSQDGGAWGDDLSQAFTREA
ncbi:MAG: uncharacterized protein JWL96_1636 [Sphingomonas bacterium]|uniref:hypothetical protein n=1 Tax=Sphingomonas bacterium TaxID=1895847 RepID=UPI00260323BD|nr:hypothetical protein [Sphingomonas bacterium]MDB5709566.1 uncharacterized protein [Sphingomonas bacterium]